MKILIGTKNNGKIKEIKKILNGIDVTILTPNDLGIKKKPLENGKDFWENSITKARFYHELSSYPTLAEDSGLEVEALNGLPGVHSARFAGDQASDKENWEKLLLLLKDLPKEKRKARFICVVSFIDKNGDIKFFEGKVEGVITKEAIGERGFGYDPIFFVSEKGKTMAQLTEDEKNLISHRGKAWREAKAYLEKIIRSNKNRGVAQPG
ncbi:MAG: XTP/dITP diphosphatase [Deltaproteobacteria bacterium]|nr:XTP/dITP diphosphatase [Deltaproteobacteria bacterium]